LLLRSEAMPKIAGESAAITLPEWVDRTKWRRVKLGEVVHQVRDKVDSASAAGISHYLPGGGISASSFKINGLKTVDDGIMGPAFHMRFTPGHVLYKSRVPHGVAVADQIAICANTTYVLEANSELLDQRLLPFLLITDKFRQFEKDNNRGSTNLFLNFSDIARFEFDLPPLDQQRRISEILWAVDEVDQSWRAAELALEKAYTAKLNAMMLGITDGTEQKLRDIGDFSPPSGWKVQRAQELVSSPITKGATPSRHLNTKNATVPFLKVYNLTFNGALDFTIDPTYVEPIIHETELKRSRVRPGDILMNIVGPPLGKTALVPDGFSEANVNQAIAIYRISDPTIRGFFAEYLRTDLAQKWLERRSKKTSGQQNLTLGLAQDLPVPIPPAQILSEVVKVAAEWSEAKQRIDTVLKDSIALGKCISNLL
jgi:hypothetical protein